jgi:hypothetical protein
LALETFWLGIMKCMIKCCYSGAFEWHQIYLSFLGLGVASWSFSSLLCKLHLWIDHIWHVGEYWFGLSDLVETLAFSKAFLPRGLKKVVLMYSQWQSWERKVSEYKQCPHRYIKCWHLTLEIKSFWIFKYFL